VTSVLIALKRRSDQNMRHLCTVALTIMLTLAAVPAPAQISAPVVVDREGYINGTPLTAHTTAAFNSTGASTVIVFLSTHPSWNGLPVSISGVSDNLGNTWNVLTGPTAWPGSSFTLLSGIYYVNAPVTSATHAVTVTLTNPAPFVMHVFAVTGSEVAGPPIYSPITGPDPGGISADVLSQPITVPANTLLLSWTKNESSATAAALDGWNLDSASTSFLWAAEQTAHSAGAYDAHFSYSSPIGWQTAIVGLTPASGPTAVSQSVVTNQGSAVNITLTATSPQNLPLTYTVLTAPAHGQLSGAAPNLIYTPAAGYSGSDSFTFKANDGASDSNVATVSITIRAPNQPPVANDATVIVQTGTTARITLSASDPNGDPLTYTVLTLPAHGQLSGTPPNLSYTPNASYVGSDSFTFKANDGTSDSNTAHINITVTAITATPQVVSSTGYLNGTPLTVHTTAAFNSVGASTLVVFLSTHPSWNGLPVSISGVSDNLGNTWNVLTGPTAWPGSSFTLLSGIYYVNAPVTSATHAVTVSLTNPAPFVMHVFAVSGSEVAGPPIYSPITGPGPGGASADVLSQPITVPAGTLLLAWTKNESNATATALDGWTLDPASTSFLWAAGQYGFSSGTYRGHFSYSSSIGWQTAVVGLQPAPGTPDTTIDSGPANPTNSNSPTFTFHADVGSAFQCSLDGSAFTSCTSPKGYSGLADGSHTFQVRAIDAAGNTDPTPASFTWIIDTNAPATPTLTATPANPTNQTGASFSFTDTEAGVTFLCGLDGAAFAACSSPKSYSGLSQGSHTFSVKAQDAAGNQSAAASFAWTIDTAAPPKPTITATPADPTNQTSASFSFSDNQAGVSFLCQLDGAAFAACSSPKTYSVLSQGSHTFSVRAQDGAGNQSNTTSFTWTIDTTAPLTPTITSNPANPTNQTAASFSFTDAESGVAFLCKLDESAFSACSSPKSYSGLPQGSHTFSLKVQDPAGNQSAEASVTWIIETTAPPTPTITSNPTNPTNQTAASFSFTDAEAGVAFLCKLDGSAFSACSSPKSYSGLSQGSHIFSVKVQDSAGNQSAAASFTWTIDTTAPTPTLTATPANPTNQTSASFSFTDTEAGVTFLCQLDGGVFSICASPTAYSGLSQGSHTFAVKAQDALGSQSPVRSFTWTVDTTPPPTPTITSAPASSTSQKNAQFKFTDAEAGVTFRCQLDGGTFSACSSPQGYSGLSSTSHTFSVLAQDAAGNQSPPATFTWTITR
jgi:Bacterial Ig domain